MELSKLISAALAKADDSTKVASLRDVPLEDQAFQRVDDYLMGELQQRPPEEIQKQASAPAVEPPGGMDSVRRAIKLASALEAGAMVVEKLADSQGPAGPVPVQPMPFANAHTQKPKPQASAHARALDARKTDSHGKLETDENKRIDGPVIIPENYRTSRTPAGTSQKHASSRQEMVRLLNQKVAEHRVFVSLGQTEAAADALQKAAEIENVLKTNDALGTHFPDNEGVRNLTKAQARDANQREAGAFFGEPVKRDNAVPAHTLRTDGLKLSAKKQRSDGGTGSAIGGGLAGPLGAAIGAGVTGDKHNRGRRALGAAGGSFAGTLGGALAGAATRNHAAMNLGAHAGGAAGGYYGNKMVHDRTKHEKRAADALRKLAKGKSEGSGSLGAGLGGALIGPMGAAAGAATSGSQHNAGRRAAGAGLGSLAGAVGGAGLGAYSALRGHPQNVGSAMRRAIGGGIAGSALGGAGGNAAVNAMTKKEKRSSDGTGGAALGGAIGGPLGGAIGAGVSGDKHNRGRRALGAAAGGLGGALGGRALGQRLGGSTLQGKVLAGIAGQMVGGSAGSAAGNKAVGKLTKKAARAMATHAADDEEHPAVKQSADSKKSRDRATREYRSAGGHGAALGSSLGHLLHDRRGGVVGGAVGAGLSGDSKNRGRRALGAAVGAHGGGELGRAAGALLAGGVGASLHGRGAKALSAARGGGVMGDYIGSVYGASYGAGGAHALSKDKKAALVPAAGNLLANVGQRVAQYGTRAVGAVKRLAQPAAAAGAKTPGTGLVLRSSTAPQHGPAQGLSRKTHQIIGGTALGGGALVAGSGVNSALGGGR